MSDQYHLDDIKTLSDLGKKVRDFKVYSFENIRRIKQKLQDISEQINQKVYQYEHEEKKAAQLERIAFNELQSCRNSGYIDKNGNYHPPNCSRHEIQYEKAKSEHNECIKRLENSKSIRSRVFTSINEFLREESKFMVLVVEKTEKSLNTLGSLTNFYQNLYTDTLNTNRNHSLSNQKPYIFNRSNINQTILDTEGNHSSLYRLARKAFIYQSINDPNVPKYIKGWIKQELNRNGTNYIRNHPGFDVGHKIPGLDDPRNFRWESTDMNRIRGAKHKR